MNSRKIGLIAAILSVFCLNVLLESPLNLSKERKLDREFAEGFDSGRKQPTFF